MHDVCARRGARHEGNGFTHKEGDIVTIATPGLGSLTNRMRRSRERPP
ncbi:hypothetical protein G5V57_33285 [Nordella sp. HKS 07]|nr:hypothetical protein G5V57_33285 [Nordella sp. HKS 07]